MAKVRTRPKFPWQGLDERPAAFADVADWFRSLSRPHLQSLWVATIVEAAVEAKIEGEPLSIQQLANALAAVRESLPACSLRTPRFADDSGND